MGLTLISGCALIALGPTAMLWTLIVRTRPALVIIGIVSAFFWLASMTLASVLWTIAPWAQGAWILLVISGVGLQGFGRVVLARLYLGAEKIVNEARNDASATTSGIPRGREERGGNGQSQRHGAIAAVGMGVGESDSLEPDRGEASSSIELNGVSSAIAAGVGWSAVHVTVMVGTAWSKHFGPGAAFSPSCPRLPSLLVSALSAHAFSILDVLLMAAAFAATRSRNVTLLSFSFASHYVAALTTGFNLVDGGCSISLPALYSVVILSAVALARWGPLRSAMTRLRR